MTINLPRIFRRFSCFTSALSVLLVSVFPARAEVLNDNATRQIWKLKYGVSNAQLIDAGWLLQDSDGDGLTNAVESTAGTHPFNAGSAVRITSITNGGASVDLTFSTENGKEYVVQATPALTTAFTNTAVVEVGTGVPKTVTVPKGSNKFFRVLVRDIDTDADGVGNWAELAVTLNPGAAETVPGTNDLAYVNAQIALPNVVSIHATDPFASEDGPVAGKLTVTRTQNLFPITVNYTLSGTAAEGSDYAMLPSHSLAFAARGATSQDIFVNPTNQPAVEGSKSVTSTLTPPGQVEFPFTLGAPSSATVIIKDSTVPTGTGLLARYYDNPGEAKTYTFARNGGTSTTDGVATINHTGSPAVTAGDTVTIQFTGGTMSATGFNVLNNFVVATVNPGVSFTVAINGVNIPANQATNANCWVSFPSYNPTAAITRVEATVTNEWMSGTPNGNSLTVGTNTTANPPDNWSSTWEGYLHPTTAGSYQFQLDGDDKARVLIDLNRNGTFDLPAEQILEHGWDMVGTGSPEDGVADDETIGTFKVSSAYSLDAPTAGDSANRYKIRVQMVESTGEARCRFQWRLGTAGFSNIPQSNVFMHAAAMSANYSYTRTGTGSPNTGTITVTLNGHGLVAGNPVELAFSSGVLFTPANGNFHGAFTVAASPAPTANTFVVNISAAALPTGTASTGAGFVVNRPTSTTTGWYNLVYTNTTFTAPPGRVGTNNNGTNDSNNGLYGVGTPDVALINPDTFRVRWTGQVQPQFTEDYTFIVHADDGASLRINGQLQEMKTVPSTFSQIGATNNYSYNGVVGPGGGDVVVTYSTGVVKPNSFVVGEPVRLDFTSGQLTHGDGSTYTYDGVTGVMAVNYSNVTNITPGGFQAGDVIELDPTAGALSSLSTLPYTVLASPAPTATTFAVYVQPGLFDSQATAATINVLDIRNATITAVTSNTFTVNIGTGKYSSGAGNVNVEIINKPLKDWSPMGNERYCRVPLVGGTRYDIQLDYWENGGFARCHLYWYSPNQPKQIIPQERLYPENVPQAPTVHITATDYSALVGGAVSIPVAGSNGAVVNVTGLPPGMSYLNGLITGTPTTAGDYQIAITVTNDDGTSTSVMNVHVEANSGTVSHDYWNGVHADLAAIPTGTTPTGSGTLSSLSSENAGDDFGRRIRGYITAPLTGNYYFWIAGSDDAELWISNDNEPINAFKRAWVTTGSATPLNWSINPLTDPGQKSAWLALEQGKKYYFEVLQKALTGADNVAVGWLKPGQSGTAPSEVVPGYALSTYTPPAAGSTPGTLYVATMLSQNGADTNGVGSVTFRLSEDENSALITFTYSGLTGVLTDWHVHNDPFLTQPSDIRYDPNFPPANSGPQPDHNPPTFYSHKWTFPPTMGTMTKAQFVELLKQGKAYINLHTALYPAGEIRGNLTLASGSRTFTPPPAPPLWTDDSATDAGAARFLAQATYGANIADINALNTLAPTGGSAGLYPASRYEKWIDDQFALSPSSSSLHLPEVLRTENASAQGGAWAEELFMNAWWWKAITGPDQLRQRVAFALSEIHVISAQGPLDNEARAIAYFYDKLVDNAFGNFRDILEDTTLTPGMGRYLDMLNNDKPDQTVGRIPNENYAREIKQLFAIGLFRQWPDGTLMLTSKDTPIDTYKQPEIIGFAHVFTGWTAGYDGAYRTSLNAPTNWMRQMREVPARHYTGTKRILNNEVLPGLPSLGGQTVDPIATHTPNLYQNAAYEALPAQELDASHDQLFNHPNTGPFICRQLIQRLVTSHPSRDYLYRVVSKFNNNGSGIRGDMKAVIKAILLDYEARHPDLIDDPGFGKQRESLLRVTGAARAFRRNGFSGTYAQTGTRTITVTANGHGFQNNDNVFLDFTTGSPAPFKGSYGISGVTTNTFTVQAQGWSNTVNYNIPAGSTTCTVTYGGHWLAAGNQIWADFLTGTNMPADGIYTVADPDPSITQGTAEDYPNVFSGNSFNITVASNPSARSGTLQFPRFTPGSYSVAASGLTTPGQERRVTMDTNINHELNVGDQVSLNFYNAANINQLPADYIATVETVGTGGDLNTWTFLAPTASFSATNNNYDAVYQFPLKTLPVVRSGDVSNRPSTFLVNNTTTDLEMAPMYAPTVFNFYLPDYKFPGALASQGLTTPEFQTTAETTVIRQANYLYNGIFGMDNDNGLSSFSNGNGALVMDFSPWYANATTDGFGAGPQTGQAWTSNANLSTLIDHLNTLLVAGQLNASVKDRIIKFVFGNSSTSTAPISSISPAGTASPITVTTAEAHGLTTGDSITIQGVTGTFTAINGTFTITVTGANTFTVPIARGAGTTATLTSAHFSPVAYNNSSPSNANKRDRLRAIIHLILTSPDYTIQR